MDAKKCDRCGAFYIPVLETPVMKDKQIYLARFRPNCLNDKWVDICETCAKSLEYWANHPEIDDMFRKEIDNVQVTVEDSKKKRVRRSKVDGKSAN